MDEASEVKADGHDENDTQLPKLRIWASALRVMAVLWWIMGGVFLFAYLCEIDQWMRIGPSTVIVLHVALILFGSALGGMLLYAFSYVMVSVGETEDNTLILVEALDEEKSEDNKTEEDKADV